MDNAKQIHKEIIEEFYEPLGKGRFRHKITDDIIYQKD